MLCINVRSKFHQPENFNSNKIMFEKYASYIYATSKYIIIDLTSEGFLATYRTWRHQRLLYLQQYSVLIYFNSNSYQKENLTQYNDFSKKHIEDISILHLNISSYSTDMSRIFS